MITYYECNNIENLYGNSHITLINLGIVKKDILMLQPISSFTNNNSKKTPFGTSYRLNVSNGKTLETLYDINRLLNKKNIKLHKFMRAQPNTGDPSDVNIVIKQDALDVFVKEQISQIPAKKLEICDDSDLFIFVNKNIFPLFPNEIQVKK